MENNPKLLPEVPVEVRKDIFRSPSKRDLKEKLLAQARAQQEKVVRAQARVNRVNVDGRNKTMTFGEHIGRISLPVYFQMRALYGDQCWQDPEFVEAFFRDNPGARVKHSYNSKGNEITHKR